MEQYNYNMVNFAIQKNKYLESGTYTIDISAKERIVGAATDFGHHASGARWRRNGLITGFVQFSEKAGAPCEHRCAQRLP